MRRRRITRKELTESDKNQLKEFKQIFKGRDDCWGKIEGKCVRKKVKTSHFEEHLTGLESLGRYPLLDNGTCYWSVVDFDFKRERKRIKLAKECSIKFSKELEILGLESIWFERSKSKLIHLWLFFEKPVKAKKIRAILMSIATKLKLKVKNGEVEIFPKQDELNEEGVGNYINLPYFNGLNQEKLDTRVMLDSNSFKSISLESFLLKVPNTLSKASVINEVYDKISNTDNTKKEPNAEPKEKAKTKSKSQNVKKQKSINPINNYPYSDKVIKIILPYWIEGIRQELALCLAGYLSKQGIDRGSTHYIISKLVETTGDEELDQRFASIESTYDKAQTDGKIKGLTGLQNILKPDDLERLEKLTNNKRYESDKNSKAKYSARFDELIDIVRHENETYFLVLTNNNPVLKREIIIDNETFKPPPKNKLPWSIPNADNVKKYMVDQNYKELFDDIESYLRSNSELPDQRLYLLITAWVFHTYLMEKWTYSPILCFYAVAERGKTRTGKALTFISYRGRHTETLREANVFRASQNQGATLFFDCRDIWKKAIQQNCDDILMLRFEKGAKAERVLYPEKGAFEDTEYFDIFGATIIATNEPIHNILDTRCIPIVMQQSSKVFEHDPSPEVGLIFRERLIVWRAKCLNKQLPIQLKPSKGRLGDILKPIATIIDLIVPERRSEFDELVRSIEEDRMVEKSISIEGEILISIQKCSDEVDNNKLTIKEITEEINIERPEKERVTSHKVGRVLRSLGFEPARKHGGQRCIIYDESKLNELLQSYGIEEMSPMSPDNDRDSQPTAIFGENQGDINGDSKINNDTLNVTGTTTRDHYINQDNKKDGDNGDKYTKPTSRKKRKPTCIRGSYMKSTKAIKQYI